MEYLIPEAWFSGLPQWALLLLLAAAVAVVVKAADLVVVGASGIAQGLGVPKIVVGATIVSLGTTSPECAVSVVAAWSGEPGLALGNAVGSIIVDSGLIFGLGCLLSRLPADRFILNRQGWVQFGSGLFLVLVCWGVYRVAGNEAVIGRTMGLLFVLLLAAYLFFSVRWSRGHPELAAQMGSEAGDASQGTVRLWIGVLGGLVLVLLSSRVLICSVIELAENHWFIPKVVIAATLVAFGTSLPELVIGMTSIRRGHNELLVGNIIGADVLNVLFVVGFSAVAAPLPVVEAGASLPQILLYVHLPFMLGILVLFRIFIFRASSRGYFQRWYGAPLLLIYVVYLVLQFSLGTLGE